MTKKELRSHFRQIRNNIPSEVREKLSNIIQGELIRYMSVSVKPDAILLYAPTGSEVDTTRIRDYACQFEIPLFYPKVTGEHSMVFLQYNSTNSLSKGAFGIDEPDEGTDYNSVKDTFRNPVCIVPGLTFSSSGARCGYGKGFYDFFLSECPERFVKAAFVFSDCISYEEFAEGNDVPMDLLITEKGIINCEHSGSCL